MKKIYMTLSFSAIVSGIILRLIIFATTNTPEDLVYTTTTNNIADEAIILQIPPNDEPIVKEVEDSFKIYTLQEQYGDNISDMVFLEPTILTHDELRYLTVLHIDFDGLTQVGEIIVNQLIAEEVLDIFRELYEIGFPIERMKVIHEYEGSDNASMEDNNTHGFNFRKIAGTNIWSEHAFGLAIDINPRINPYVTENAVKPVNGIDNVDRNQEVMGMIRYGEAVYQIFTSRGWIWGGDWGQYGFRDYHHFERPLN